MNAFRSITFYFLRGNQHVTHYLVGSRMSDPCVPGSSRSKKGRHVFCPKLGPPPVMCFMNGPY